MDNTSKWASIICSSVISFFVLSGFVFSQLPAGLEITAEPYGWSKDRLDLGKVGVGETVIFEIKLQNKDKENWIRLTDGWFKIISKQGNSNRDEVRFDLEDNVLYIPPNKHVSIFLPISFPKSESEMGLWQVDVTYYISGEICKLIGDTEYTKNFESIKSFSRETGQAINSPFTFNVKNPEEIQKDLEGKPLENLGVPSLLRDILVKYGWGGVAASIIFVLIVVAYIVQIRRR